ncbi:unnamed protein product [Moneuplotes crassus]|uniref:Uncharacterized protein n=1 Tax=Euplotes crassus TaxID=5936 RepID=A0AAD1UA65_EUPCR|nr:unnamed protein product [Moneuplotes crassus]
MNKSKYDIKSKFSWTRKFNYGAWTTSEHEQFLSCLKIHGLNWSMLCQMVPTRSRQQIETHLKGYFKQIKKYHKVEDPLEYVQKFENIKSQESPIINSEVCADKQNKPTCRGDELKHKCSFEKIRNIPLDTDLRVEEEKHPKKRDNKFLHKCLQNQDSDKEMSDEEHVYQKVSIAETTRQNRVRPARIRQNPPKLEREDEKFRSDLAKSLSSSMESKEHCEPKSYLVLDEGRIIIPCVMIQTKAILDYTKIGSKILLCTPKGNVDIKMLPISLEIPLGSDLNKDRTIFQSGNYQASCSKAPHQASHQTLKSAGPSLQAFSNKTDTLVGQTVKFLSQYYCFDMCKHK